MSTTTVNGVALHYERRGAGEPLLLIQGMSGNTVHWGEAFVTDLQRDHEVVVYDHRGIGQSGAYGEPFTIAELAADAAGLLEALEIDRAHVCGISMGGMVAQELALMHPERVGALTLGCTYCGGPESTLAAPEDLQTLAESLSSGDRATTLTTMWNINVSPTYAADPAHFEMFVELAAIHPASVPLIMLQMQAIVGHDTSARLPEVQAPTLVLHGTVDRLLPVANGTLIAGLIPGARLELFPDVGHMFFWERPELSARLIREHIAAAAAVPGQ